MHYGKDYLNLVCIGIPEGIHLLSEYLSGIRRSSVHDRLPFLSSPGAENASRAENANPHLSVAV